jgi:hypothetical protein
LRVGTFRFAIDDAVLHSPHARRWRRALRPKGHLLFERRHLHAVQLVELRVQITGEHFDALLGHLVDEMNDLGDEILDVELVARVLAQGHEVARAHVQRRAARVLHDLPRLLLFCPHRGVPLGLTRFEEAAPVK